jgi:hypothetical protein
MKKKFSAIISEAELSAMESNIAALETPQKLESAILNLITNLNNQASYDDDNISMVSDSTIETDDNTRRTRSPPLSIVAPKLNTIKNSISKAVAVIGHKCQSPSIKDEPKSPETSLTQSTTPLNIKTEPTCNLLSPTSSSVSSIDSEASSPFLPQNPTQTAKYTSRQVQLNNSTNDFLSPYDNLPTYDTSTVTSATNNSIMIASNNNSSNNNRNSVLKRTYNSTDVDDGYTELIKKRTLSGYSNLQSNLEETPCMTLDLLETSGTGEIY